ncbi:MAG: phosphoribosyltransferase family protein [Lachnospiraceae bacterium]|nr:phosphoribosyltransferase family protein [Lachnospiraceae bacterium]
MNSFDKEQMQQRILQHVKKDGTRRFVDTIYQDMDCIDRVVEYLTEPYAGKVDVVAAPAVSGYILGSMIARELKVPFVPIMKADNQENSSGEDFLMASYLDHADMVRTMKLRKGALAKGAKVLLVDNWIETAATITACQSLIEVAEAEVLGIAAFGRDENAATDKLADSGLVHAAAE